MVDIARPSSARKRRWRNALFLLIAVTTLTVLTLGIARLKPAAPSIERSTLYIGTVKRGQLLRQVRGLGTLVSEDVRVIAAATEGRVERINAKPGDHVNPGTVLVELSNPTLEQVANDADYQIKAAEAEFINIRVRLESERLSQQSQTATVQAEYNQAKLQLDVDEKLAKDGLIPALNLKLASVKVGELANRLRIEQERLGISSKAKKAQLDTQQAKIEQLRALAHLNRTQVISLRVVAGTSGVLQQVSVEVGQQITPGSKIARIADPSSLKAVLQIPETQAKDILLGQPAVIDTRSGGLISGRVQRIDPAAQSGTVTVDVELEGSMPAGARPDLSVDGTVELERLENVLYIARPAFGNAQSTVTLFRIEETGQTAVRTQVKLGRSSVNTVEVVEGLREGDQVILSDTSQWDNVNRLQLK